MLDPSGLHRMQCIGIAQTLYGRHRAADGPDWRRARPHWHAIHEDSAGATQGHATTILGAWQVHFISERPQEWHFRLNVEVVRLAVHNQFHKFTPFGNS
jgi:hypothetical protein